MATNTLTRSTQKRRGAAPSEIVAEISPAKSSERSVGAARRTGAKGAPVSSASAPGAPEKSEQRRERRRIEKQVADLPPPVVATSDASTHSLMQNPEAQGRSAMRNVALDLGARKICFCEVVDDQVVQRATVGNIASLEHLLGKAQPSAKVAIEACREAWYVHDLLVSWGNEVLLVDTSRVRKLGIGQHRRKNDKIDAEVLARAVESGKIPLAHVLTPARRELREVIGVRRSLVEVRAQMVTTIRGIARQHGVKLPTCATAHFAEKLKSMQLADDIAALIAPLLALVEQADIGLAKAEAQLLNLCQKEPVVQLLATAPGIGLVVAASVVSVLDEAGRFQSAHHVESYVGLVPSENSSGGKRRIGAISKAGNCYLRALLVQAAWTVMRAKNKDNPLYLWARAVAERRGHRVAVVALARRLLGVLWAMWRDGTVYDAPHLAQQGTRGLRGAKQSLEQQQRALELAAKKSSLRKPPAKRKAPAKPQNTSAAHAA